MLISASFAALVMIALTTAYFVAWALTQIGMAGIAGLSMWRHQRRHSRRAMALVDRISLPLVSIVVPARNEELTIVESLRGLLAFDYPREIVVVNDGRRTARWRCCSGRFSCCPRRSPTCSRCPPRAVRGIYRSAADPALVVVDKESAGSKSDASNAGINAASGELVLVMDADTVLAPDALSRSVLPFLEDRSTIAAGSDVMIVNGCIVDHGRVTNVALPRSWFARLQIVEYMRAFRLFRAACASFNGLLILSGAFALFRRDAVIAVGGYDATAIGEDMDLTVRLQQYFRRRREPFRIVFVPSPLCFTQAPGRLALAQVAAAAVAAWPAAGAVAAPRDDRQPALRRRRRHHAAVYRGLRGLRATARALELRGHDGRVPDGRPRSAALRTDRPDLDVLRHGRVDDRGAAERLSPPANTCGAPIFPG
jgi:cellulose synthase/poly-beta-1,6-N-acetylglucosamine synthase-like glycosyltransferase